jgi:ABC-type transport system involved in multi-copper enzyme maturation permease subunit
MFRYIWQREMRGELYTSKGMLWLVIASVVFSFTTYLLLTNKELSLLDQTEMMWLLAKVIVAVALLVVTIDAASIVAIEFEKETIETLFLAPISLADFIVGKLLVSLSLWAAVLIVAIPYILVASAGSGLAAAFVAYMGLLGSLGVLGFAMLVLGMSVLYRSTKNTLTTALVVLLACGAPALFASSLKNTLVSRVLSSVNPVDNIVSALDNVLVDHKTSLMQNWQFILPLVMFCAIACAFLVAAAKRLERQGIIKGE